jgi:hypothetical protein
LKLPISRDEAATPYPLVVALRRFLALLVAIGLVVGAYVVRTKVIHKSKTTTTGTTIDGGDPTNPTSAPTVKPGTKPTIVCIDELRTSCEATSKATNTAITIEAAGTTLDRLAKADAATDANTIWITLTGWDELLASAQKRSVVGTASPTQTLATTAVVVTGPAERVDAISKKCAPLTWTCLGDQVGQRWDAIGGKPAWRDVEFVHTDPINTGSGLAVYAAAVAGRTGTPGAKFSRAELDDPAVSAWSKRLETFNHPAESDPLTRIANTTGFFLVGALQSQLPAGAPVATPSPAVRTGAIITAVGSPKIDPGLVTALKAALETNKWDLGVAPGVVGMPDAIALDAARTHWKQEN